MRLTKINIKNFRSIKDSGDIADVTKIFAIIGKNNTGKSSVLKALQVLMCTRTIEAEDFHKNTEESIEISATLLKFVGGERQELELKAICKKTDLETTYSINGTETSKPKFKKELPELLSIDDIRNPNESTGGGQKLTLLNKILKLQAAADTDGEYAALSQKIEDLKKKEFAVISEKISKKFQDVVNEKHFSVSVSPTVEIEKGIGYITGLTNTSIPDAKSVDILNSGTGLQSMYILTLLEVWAEMSEVQDKTVLLIEEPEVYLHPDYQRRMFAAMRRIAENNQVIFTTHSPIMIADIWLTESVRQVMLNENGETRIESVKIENVIDELGIRYEDVLNPSLVVFVEGKNDMRFFEALGITDSKLKIIYTDGFRAIHYFAFIKIISSEHVSNNFIILADGDGETPGQRGKSLEEEIYKQFQEPTPGLKGKIQGNILILNEYAIESYFLNEETLKKAFPQLDATKIGAFLSEYRAKYQEKQGEVKSGKLSIDEFRKYLKPKLIFETIKHPDFEAAYKSFWVSQTNFLAIKDLIAQRCASMDDWFGHVLSHASLGEVLELTDKKATILSRLK